jgi:hypothetical protein
VAPPRRGFGANYYGGGRAGGGGPSRARGGYGAHFAAGGARVVSARPKAKHGGFLHTLEHLPGKFATDLKDVAVNLPGGLYHTAGMAIHHPVRLGETMAKQTYTDIRHPLRHPGYTFLDALALADLGFGGIARAAEVGRAARAGELGRAARAAAFGAKPRARFIVSPDTGEKVAAGRYSRAASTRAVQKGLDQLRARYPDRRIVFRPQRDRIGVQRTRNEMIRQEYETRHTKALLGMRRGLNQAQRFSIRVVAERVPLKLRIRHAEQMIQETEIPAVKRQLKNHLNLLRRTEKYVHDVGPPGGVEVPRFKPDQEHLAHVYQRAKEVAYQRENKAIQEGVISKPGAETRRMEPARIIHKDLGLDPGHLPELFKDEPGFYVSYLNKPPAKSLMGKFAPGGLRAPESVPIPKQEAQFTNPLTGAALRAGNVHPDTLRTVAASSLSAHRLFSLLAQRKELIRLAKPRVTDPAHDIPIRPEALKNKGWTPEVHSYLNDTEHGLAPEEETTRIHAMLERMIPTHEVSRKLYQGYEVPGIQWVDKRLIGDLNRRELVPGERMTRVFKGVDLVNNAARLALVYGKLGYILPNLLGNVGLNLVQQGIFAPYNLARASRLAHYLGTEDFAAIDTGMGAGVSASIAGHTGALHRATEVIGGAFGHITDVRFRRAAFLHEAWLNGYKTRSALEALLTDADKAAERTRIFREARQEIIEYSDLGPAERDVIKRVIFLYPWVRGSTRYAGRLLGEHPVTAGVLGQAAARQTALTKKELGDLPSFLDGIFKVGTRGPHPLVVNPAAAAITGTPGQVVQAARGLVTGNVGEAYKASQFFQPILQAIAAGKGGKQPSSPLLAALENLYTGVPAVTLEERLRHPPSEARRPRIYPMTRQDALLQYLVGTIAPRPIDVARAHASAYREAHPHPYG